MVYKIFDKKTGLEASVNEELAQALHKPVNKKLKRRKVYTRLIDNIWGADLAEIGSLFSKNRDVKYFLCVIEVFTGNAWVKHLKD